MHRPSLFFEHSPWFLLLCLLAGLGYAYLQYQKPGPWGKTLEKVLFACRALVTFFIAALLVSPVLKQIENMVERPTIVLAVDNSASLIETKDSTTLSTLNKRLQNLLSGVARDYEVEYRDLSGASSEEMPADIKYDQQSTDLNNLLSDIQADYEGRNLGGVVMVSDGIYNKGMSPTFKDYSFNIYTVGVGDTVPKSDLSLVSLLYNKISYQGNKFPLIAQLTHKGFAGENVSVSVFQGSTIVDKKNIKLGADNQLEEVKFLIDANKSGYQSYTIAVERKTGEFTYANNSQRAYIEVIEGREQIAIVAPAPHPDMKAIKSAIEDNANYTLDQYILSIGDDYQKLLSTSKKYDLVIFHQIPDNRNLYSRFTEKFAKSATLIIYGPQLDLRQLNDFNEVVSVDAIPNEYDKVTATFNSSFSSFKISDDTQALLNDLPPLVVPFGKVNMKSGTDALLYQKVGSITTNKALIAVKQDGDKKQGIVLGSGLWQWKLTGYAKTGNHEAFNELITKLIQYLSSKEDKRKFKVYPIKNEFLTNEKVVFDTEVYNDLYERVYGNKISLTLTNAEGEKMNYSYLTNENNTRYEISGLPEGVYKYRATTQLGNETAAAQGEFLIKELQLETVNLTADFNLLKNISSKTGGQFYRADQLDQLERDLDNLEAKGTIHTSEKYLPFIHVEWLFFLILILISTEWFIRKYSGSY